MKSKIIYIIALTVIFTLLLSIGISAEEINADGGIEASPESISETSDALPEDSITEGKHDLSEVNDPLSKSENDLSETGDALPETGDGLPEARDNTANTTEDVDETDIGTAILAAIDEHSGEILSFLAFIGSIILAIVYKLGLAPLVRGALSSMLNSLGKLRASVEENDKICSGALSGLTERLAATEDAVKRLDEAIAVGAEAMKAEEANKGERADMRLIMQMQINMHYDIFMSSALPQYEKEAVGERISEMNKILKDRENVDRSLPEPSSVIGG